MQEVDDKTRQADELAHQKEWGAAAVLYAAAAARAAKLGEKGRARQAWEAAGESWRRDDRPLAASQALGAALGLGGTGPAAALCRVKLAGVVGELGEGQVAISLCDAAAEALEGPLRAMALDTAFDAHLAIGDKAAARVRFDRLQTTVQGLPDETAALMAMAISFRSGQLHRLDAQLSDAESFQAQVLALTEGNEMALPARAAAVAELAELAALRGHVDDALQMWDSAVADFAEVGRRGSALRAEAGRIRAQVDAGLHPMLTALDEGIGFAEQRQMVVLECDLRLARGVGLSGTDPKAAAADLEQSAATAERLGHRWRAGRARLELARRFEGAAASREAHAVAAEALLAGNDPWQLRARLARVELAFDRDRAAGRAEALAIFARATAADMTPELESARDLLDR